MLRLQMTTCPSRARAFLRCSRSRVSSSGRSLNFPWKHLSSAAGGYVPGPELGNDLATQEVGSFQRPFAISIEDSCVRARDLLGQEMGQGAPQIPADLHIARLPGIGLKPSST